MYVFTDREGTKCPKETILGRRYNLTPRHSINVFSDPGLSRALELVEKKDIHRGFKTSKNDIFS